MELLGVTAGMGLSADLFNDGCGGSVCSKAQIHDLALVKNHDFMSSKLMIACANSTYFERVIIECYLDKKHDVIRTYVLKGVSIASFYTDGTLDHVGLGVATSTRTDNPMSLASYARP